MLPTNNLKDTLKYCIFTVVSFLILQSLLILMHEFTHSTTSYLLGYTPKPFSIIWGNYLMMTGWDEGVPYSRLFTTPGNHAEAVIGAMPLLVHALIVIFSLLLLTRSFMLRHKWIFHFCYWFLIANMMELTAYIIMRPFASGGDTGHFNHGLNISPWYLFICGTVMLLYALYLIFAKVLPRLYLLFAASNQITRVAILTFTSFIIFVWGSCSISTRNQAGYSVF